MKVHGEGFRSQFPVFSAFRTPPLISQNRDFGPLLFVPVPGSLVPLVPSSSLLFPPQFPPQHNLPGYLTAAGSVPYSSATSIASQFGPQPDRAASTAFSHNRLRLLQCSSAGVCIAFFATGENSDQLGFVVFDSEFKVQFDDIGQPLRVSSKQFSHSIVRILVNAISGHDDCFIGYIMACTLYSAHWFGAKRVHETGKIEVVYLGSKTFKTSGIAGACWSLHFPEQCAVLLENGSVFLFDLGEEGVISGSRLEVSWNKLVKSDRAAKWLGCEFSLHPQILILSRSDAVFKLDFRSDPYKVTCLANIQMSGAYASVDTDRFLTCCMAGDDGFHFVVASNRLLILCDMRKPLEPVLQWVHGIDKPCCIDVFKLSQLRFGAQDDSFRQASESGFCVLLGSFWSCDFGLFCYGPQMPLTKVSRDSKFLGTCKSFFAWELPSEFPLLGGDCRSGSCLVKEDFSKNDLPVWVDWRQKKDIVIGFGIIRSDLLSVPSEENKFGGFTVVRLLSSGKLEAQRYCASWEPAIDREKVESGPALSFEDNMLDSVVDEGYKFERKFKYIKLDYLTAFLRGDLSKKLQLSLKKCSRSPLVEDLFNPEFHDILCKMLRTRGFTQSRSLPAISLVFEGIDSPTTIREIALMRIWSELPVGLLQLAFSSYSEVLRIQVAYKTFSHDFPVVSELPQLPPFILRNPSCRSNKWSRSVRRSKDYIVGPIVPLPVLSFLQRSHAGLDPEADEEGVDSHIDKVMQVAAQVARAESSVEIPGDHAVSLSEDMDEEWVGSQNQKRRFLLYEPGSFKPRRDDKCARLVSRVVPERNPVPGGCSQDTTQGQSGLEFFDDLCPIKLTFDDRTPIQISSKEWKAYVQLKKHFLKRQERASGH